MRILSKLDTIYKQNLPIEYFIEDNINLNSYIGKKISIEFQNVFTCLDCKKNVKKLYSQGLCYICTYNSPSNSPCIINPELCEAHLGIGRDVKWELENHNQDHIVYISFTGNVKVGVTRQTQIPYRWIDQGADFAIILAQTPNRRFAGDIEVFLKDFFSDKTNYRKMLVDQSSTKMDLLEYKNKAKELLSKEIHQKYISQDDNTYNLKYPCNEIFDKIKSIRLDTIPNISGVLTGIKGQYLIFDNKNVFNVRNHSGYNVKLTL